MKKLLIAVTALAITAGLVSISSAAELKGSLKIAGSTTVLPLSQVWAEDFMANHPGISISVSGGGSGTGLSMLLNGSCDVANASRAAKTKEIDAAKARNSKMVATKLAKDGLAIVVNSDNNVKNMTMDQLNAVYSGRTSNWKDLGGDNSKMVVIGRDSSSGTYGFFQEVVLGGRAYRSDMLSMASNAAIAQAVAQSKDAIGYVGIAYAKKLVDSGKARILTVSLKKGQPGIACSDENIANGKYPLFRYLFAYTLGKPSGIAGEFMKYCTGPGQAKVHKSGYLPL